MKSKKKLKKEAPRLIRLRKGGIILVSSLSVFLIVLSLSYVYKQHNTQTVLSANNSTHPYCNNWPSIIGTTKSPNASYFPTWFGCSYLGDDKNDNCKGACGVNASGERNMRWFTADADRYGCGTKVKITNKSGKSVIAQVVDKGPDCRVEENQAHQRIMDLSRDTYCTLGFNNGASNVTVTVVSSGSKLGPTDGYIPSNCIAGPFRKPTPTPTLDPRKPTQKLCASGRVCMSGQQCHGTGGISKNSCNGGYFCCDYSNARNY